MARLSVCPNGALELGTLLAALLGCGGGEPLAPVEGVVRLDGQPVADADVIFIPAAGGQPATGVTDAEGVFALQTGARLGAALGEHSVAISKTQAAGQAAITPTEFGTMPDPAAGPSAPPTMLLPEKYRRATNSGLRAEVKPGSNAPEFNLTTR